MPDISMCQNRQCPSREKCFRYRAIPNGDRQCWQSFEVPKGRKKCDAFKRLYPTTKTVPMSTLEPENSNG